MTHPTLEDAAKALFESDIGYPAVDGVTWGDLAPSIEQDHYRELARAVLLSIRPPDREDLSMRQLEARDYIDGILEK